MEIASAADTTVMLVVPGMSDSIQAAKAGVLEVPDELAARVADGQCDPAEAAEELLAATVMPKI